MPTIRLVTRIHAPCERCFDLSRSVALHLESTKHTGERVVDGRRTGLFECGDEVEWEALHFGIRQRLRVRITAMERSEHFTDEMVRGAFGFMRHEHHFMQEDDVCVMQDVFAFASPFGVLGTIFDAFVLKHYLRRLLKIRNLVIRQAAEGDAWKTLLVR